LEEANAWEVFMGPNLPIGTTRMRRTAWINIKALAEVRHQGDPRRRR